jgi:hypothetical protein
MSLIKESTRQGKSTVGKRRNRNSDLKVKRKKKKKETSLIKNEVIHAIYLL